MPHHLQVLSVPQMYEADRLAIESGISGLELMENAGQGIAAHIEEGWDACSVLILCGPGNNGGDGYVVARALSEAGWPVAVHTFGDPEKLSGDAKMMFELYLGDTFPLSEIDLSGTELVVDALFGAGFKGELPDEIRNLFLEIKNKEIPFVAVDVPSGVNGSSGEICPGTIEANLTVSFFRPKIGHLLYPARSYIGALDIVDIGIPEEVLDTIDVRISDNDPDLWLDNMPKYLASDHKYSRGHAAIVGGGMSSTGAARISARAALRAGAGAVTVVSPPSALMIYSQAQEAVMVKSVEDDLQFSDWLKEKRINTVLVGPGNGIKERTRTFVEMSLKLDCSVILDADALTVFKDDPDKLFGLIKNKNKGQVVITPHEAEFVRLFDLSGSNLERCQQASTLSGAIVLLKGATTVIADPDGQAVMNTIAPPWLATAGSGDALAGIIAGLAASTIDLYKATCAAVWIHSEAANEFGPGLIAEDIETIIPRVLSNINNL